MFASEISHLMPPFRKGPSGFSVGKNFSRVPFKGDLKAIAEVDRNHDLSFTVGALKSPFEKGDLGGFCAVYYG